MGRTEKIEFTVSEEEKEIIQFGAFCLGVPTSHFVRSAALAQSLPMADVQAMVRRKKRLDK